MVQRGLVAALLVLAVTAGCAPATEQEDNKRTPTDATYEVPPSRKVAGLDGGGSGAGGANAALGSGMGGAGGAMSGAGGSGAGGSGSGAGGAGGSGAMTTVSCNVSRSGDCPTGQMCLPSTFAEKMDTGGICYPEGKRGYKEGCSQHQDCSAGLVCSPDTKDGCRWGCDPTDGTCPDGGKCVALERYNRTGYCADP
jgi:hypothetical protein